jgi:tripartite-type tricarboxylate transporter receptor subunit TctC
MAVRGSGSIRRVQVARCALAFWCLTSVAAHAADVARFPARPIILVVGFAPGGGIDVNARLLARDLGAHFGQSVIVENRPGAGSRIADEYVARAAADGHTLLVGSAAMTIDMAFGRQETQFLRDLKPVSTIATTPLVLVVNPSVAATSARELIALARMRPGALNYASSGPGTTPHLYGELFKLRTGTRIVHIPFKGTAPALSAVIAGDVEMTFAPLPGALPHLRTGRVRALATTGAARSRLLPGVPTIAEATGLQGMDASVWYGVFAPAATPPDVVDTLARAIGDVVRAPAFEQQLSALGEEPEVEPTARFDALLHDEVARWSGVIKDARIHAE